MNINVKFNTNYSQERLERHREYAGSISNQDFCTYDAKLKKLPYTLVERSVYKRIRKAAFRKSEYNNYKGGELV